MALSGHVKKCRVRVERLAVVYEVNIVRRDLKLVFYEGERFTSYLRAHIRFYISTEKQYNFNSDPALCLNMLERGDWLKVYFETIENEVVGFNVVQESLPTRVRKGYLEVYYFVPFNLGHFLLHIILQNCGPTENKHFWSDKSL